MNNELKIFAFLAIDDLYDINTIKKQLSDIKSLDFNGIVFHPRRYSGSPVYLSDEYMKIVSEIILFAKKLDMQFWIYDENGWPSGSADGQVLGSIPDLKCKWLEYTDGTVELKERTAINSLDPRGVSKFIELTHEAYKNKLMPEAFDWVGGFFSDEVGFLEGHGACMEYGGIPWTDTIAQKYKHTFDKEIYNELPKLFNEEADSFKSWYWESLCEQLSNTFYGMIERWCKANGKLFTAHLKGEEDPFFQIGYSGSCFGALKSVSVPGIDVLGRYAGNPYYLRIASSISRQFGSGLAMAEIMGGAGWGITPADVAAYTDKLIDCGTNMFVFHINQQHLTYAGICDWPASIPCHEPWRDAFLQLADRMRKRAAAIKPADTLLIAPVRGTMENFAPSLVKGMNEHDGSYQMLSASSVISRGAVTAGERLYKAGISFDVTDEKTFEDNAVFEKNAVRLGNAVYKRAVTVSGCVFNKSSFAMQPYEELFAKGIRQTPWRFTPPDENIYPVEITDGHGIIDAEYICDCMLTVSDECVVKVNGIKHKCEYRDEHGGHYRLCGLKTGNNTVELSINKAFAYVTGNFRVLNRKPFYEFDARQLRTQNGFYIASPGGCGSDLILSGYPFAFEPVMAEKTLEGDISGRVKIDCAHIAAARVFVDGEDHGWIYPGSDIIRIIGAKQHSEITCVIYQSAYNLYGPHHHLEGDRPLVSPMQYTGEKNFADTPSLPENTYEGDIKLIKWQLSDYVEFIR